MWKRLHVKHPLFLSNFHKTCMFSADFRRSLKYQNPSWGAAELFHADKQTDRHDEANSRFSQFCESA